MKKSIKKREDKKETIFAEFARFATQGRVLDLTIGIMIGASLTDLVNSFVSNILLPPINIFTERINFNDLYINLSRVHVDSLAEAEQKGLPVIKIGQFANDLIDFVIIAIVVFIIVNKVLGYSKPAKK